VFSVSSYVAGLPHDGQSPWYFWPVGQIPLIYYSGTSGGGPLVFAGNEVVWLGSAFAVILALALAIRYTKEHHLTQKNRRPFITLIAGYVGCMLPFIVLVERSTFLYHYLPALIFAIGLLGVFTGKFLGVEEWRDFTPRKIFLLSIVLAAVVAGFAALAPVTYGL